MLFFLNETVVDDGSTYTIPLPQLPDNFVITSAGSLCDGTAISQMNVQDVNSSVAPIGNCIGTSVNSGILKAPYVLNITTSSLTGTNQNVQIAIDGFPVAGSDAGQVIQIPTGSTSPALAIDAPFIDVSVGIALWVLVCAFIIRFIFRK